MTVTKMSLIATSDFPWDTVETLSSSKCISLIVLEAMSLGAAKWAQVWKGKIRDLTVAINIFDEELFPDTEDLVDPVSGEILAHREVLMYEKMKKHQGTRIPHSYGLYKFSSGSRSALAHIMQFVDQPTLSKLRPTFSDADGHRLLDHLIPCLAELHQCGVAHHDIDNPMNILCDGSFSKPVIIDFSFSVDANEKTIEYDACSVIGLLTCMGIYDAAGLVLDWKPRKSFTMFDGVRLTRRKVDSTYGVYPDFEKWWGPQVAWPAWENLI